MTSTTSTDHGHPRPGSEAPTRGYTMTKDAYAKRLNRIEGQVRGIRRMIEDDAYCIDVLTQVSAATRALQAVAVGLLDEHLHHCVTHAADEGDPEVMAEKLTEATKAIERLIRS